MRWDRNYKEPDPPINDPVIIPAYGVTDEERAYWNQKQDPLEYDPEPTPYSDKLMISGAIFNALEKYKVQTVQSCQDFYWTIAGGLAETQEIVTAAVDTVNAAKDAAAESQADAFASKQAAATSASNAYVYSSQALVSKNNADVAATNSRNSATDSEAWATGKRNGIDVPATDPAYHNNSRYYAGLGSDVLQDDIITTYTTWSSSKLSTDFAGKADLVDGKIPASQLPSYVDDIEEYASTAEFPETGETGKIYVALDTNKLYRWSGTIYAEVSESLALGETSSTAYPGNLGKHNADTLATLALLIPETASSSNKLAPRNELPTQLSQLSDDSSHRVVTDAEKAEWDGKADAVHNHDDRYYTETEIDTALQGKANAVHNHDDRYYTETEIDTKFNGVTFTTVDNVKYINW